MDTIAAHIAAGEEVREASTHRFRHARKTPRRLALTFAMAAVLFLVQGASGFVDVAGPLGLMVLLPLSALAAIYAVLARHPAVTLEVGPDGIALPFSLTGPVPWPSVRAITCESGRFVEGQRMQWMAVRVDPRAVPEFRWYALRRLTAPLTRRDTIRLALHELHGPTEDIVHSVERFHPVETVFLDD